MNNTINQLTNKVANKITNIVTNKRINHMTQLTYCMLLSSIMFNQTVFAKETALSDKVVACSQISDNSLRLSCFDALTNKGGVVVVSKTVTLISKSETVTSKSVATEKLPLNSQQIDAFGKEHLKKTSEEQANEITTISLIIAQLSKTAYGQWKITFKNGQKWQQKDTVKLKLSKGEQVTLTKGALSAVFLKKENTNKRIKVKRLK